MIELKKLNPNLHATKKYLSWLKESDVKRFTDIKYQKFSIKKIKEFIYEKNKSKNEFLLGIFLKKNNIHIGNVKIGPINTFDKTAEISYFIGDPDNRGRGYATLAIKKAIIFSKKIKLKKLKVTGFEINYASKKIIEKNGFYREGRLKSELLHNKKRYSAFIYAKIL
jgi:RimJ/RimL family protein N-acetyltransferase